MSPATGVPPHSGEVVVHVFGRTDVGRTREHNEDSFVVVDLSRDNATLQPDVRTHVLGPKGSLFMVADGMGGAAAGEIASAMAVEITVDELRTIWLADAHNDAEGFARAIKQAAKIANERIHAFATSHPEYRGMGTTATIAGLLGDTLYLAQVGDSRAYVVRHGEARQITKDQSLIQKLVEAGELTEEEAALSERRNIILQALGPEPTIKVDLTHQQVRRGDTLVLCSDGLSGQVSKDAIARVVSEESDLTQACKRLIDLANAAGGPDNITVIIVRFDGTGLVSANSGDHVGHRVFQLPDTGQTPAIGIERVTSETPTQPMPVAPREPEPAAQPPVARTTRPMALEPDEIRRPTTPIVQPHVSPVRRSTGRLVAVLLFLAVIVTAAWYVVHTARKVTPGGNAGTASTGR